MLAKYSFLKNPLIFTLFFVISLKMPAQVKSNFWDKVKWGGSAGLDFGTGYSSLSYLRRLPINQIKLDREFIDNLTNNSQDASIVQSIIHLAHQLNLEVVAEGVETLEQAKILHYQNCDLLQGYFYTKPVELNNLIFKYYSLEEC